MLFYGNRIRSKDNDAEKAYFEAFATLMSAFISFLKERRDSICDWTGKSSGAEAKAFYEAQISGASGASAAATPAAAAKPAEETKQAAKPAPKKAAPAQKTPIREMQGRSMVIENWTNETLRFDKEEEVGNMV